MTEHSNPTDISELDIEILKKLSLESIFCYYFEY